MNPATTELSVAFDESGARILQGNVLDVLGELPDDHYHCIVTSPPYWALRSYLDADDPLKPLELGSEPTPAEYIANQVAVFHECRRVLHPAGVLFVNIGETYNAGRNGGWAGGNGGVSKPENAQPRSGVNVDNCQPGEPVGIPDMLKNALRADGWRHRDTIIWHKPSCMPASLAGWRWERHRVKVAEGEYLGRRDPARGDIASSAHHPKAATWADCPGCDKCNSNGGYVLRKGQWRTTTAHEYLFMFVKSDRYFCDAAEVKEPAVGNASGNTERKIGEERGRPGSHLAGSVPWEGSATRNPRSVQTWAAEPCKFTHYAAFPSAIPRFCIKAATSPKGCCPECGLPWSPVVETDGETTTEKRKRLGYSEQRKRLGYSEQRGTGGKQVAQNLDYGGGHGNNQRSSRVLYYRPSCQCQPQDPIPCRVLDPFSGTATTLQTALELGCEADGIELNHKYIADAITRLSAYMVPKGMAPAMSATGPLFGNQA